MSNNLNTVTRIGAGERLVETSVPAIVATLPALAGLESKAVTKAITEAVHVWACGTAKRPAQKTGPAGSQKTTDYGRGVDRLVKAVKRDLSAGQEKPVRLAVTLSGTDVNGGTVVVETSHELYARLVALVEASNASE